MGNKLPFEENITVWHVSTIATLTAPTDVEINAGTDITCLLTKDGLAFNVSTGSIDAGTLCSRLNATDPGSVDAKPHVKGYQLDDDNDLWDLIVWNEPGYLVVRPMAAYNTNAVAADKVWVFKGKWGEKMPINSASNTDQMVEADWFVSAYTYEATVADGTP